MSIKQGKFLPNDRSQLSNIIKNNELSIHYQPQYNLRSGSFDGFEALARWRHPELGLMGTRDLFLVMEQADLVADLGNWVLEKACHQYHDWLHQGVPVKRMSINVSSVQLASNDIVDLIQHLLESYAIVPSCLEIELVEDIVIHANSLALINRIHLIKELGVDIALDDFGTSCSSINQLKLITVDHIKIDKSFVENILTNKVDLAIIKAILALGSELGVGVIVEGVETAKQLKFLQELGAKQMQGYYFSPPLEPAELVKFLKFYQNKPFL